MKAFFLLLLILCICIGYQLLRRRARHAAPLRQAPRAKRSSGLQWYLVGAVVVVIGGVNVIAVLGDRLSTLQQVSLGLLLLLALCVPILFVARRD